VDTSFIRQHPSSAAMDCVFHVYMQQEDKAMVMTLYMTVVKQYLLTTHLDTNNNNIYDSSEIINTHNKA
jgi:hypothetical protein